MSRNADVFSIPSYRVVMAPGAIVRVGPFNKQLSTTIKLLEGGTLEMGGFQDMPFNSSGFTVFAGNATFLTGQTFAQMYAFSTNEAFSANLSGYVNLYSSGGATCVVAIASGKSEP